MEGGFCLHSCCGGNLQRRFLSNVALFLFNRLELDFSWKAIIWVEFTTPPPVIDSIILSKFSTHNKYHHQLLVKLEGSNYFLVLLKRLVLGRFQFHMLMQCPSLFNICITFFCPVILWSPRASARCLAVVIFFQLIVSMKSDANELTILLTFSVDLTRYSKNCIILSGKCSALSKLSIWGGQSISGRLLGYSIISLRSNCAASFIITSLLFNNK